MPATNLKKDNSQEDRAIGQKAKGLYFLEKNKFRVPVFYLIDFLTLTEILHNDKALKEWIYKWKTEHSISTDSLWAVRSSTDVEDGKVKSFAGLFKSEINIATENLEAAIRSVGESYEKAKQLNYTSGNAFKSGIIIQEMIAAEYSGVIFSHHPLNLRDDTIHINVIPGLGESLVSGKEDAFLITYQNNVFTYLEPDNLYKGYVFANGLNEVVKSGNEIRSEISFGLEELVSGVKKLSSLLKYPVDAEFAIAGNKLYWLQVRPATSGQTGEISIWDNTSVEANYPGITLPLTISLVNNSLYHAYTGMGLYLGMDEKIISRNEQLLKNMSGEINGGLYYNVTAWQKLVYQLPFGKKASAVLPKIWGMSETPFDPGDFKIPFWIKTKLVTGLLNSFVRMKRIKKNYLADHSSVMEEYKNIDLSAKAYPELVAIYFDIEKRFGNKWIAPVLNGFFAVIFSTALKKTIAGTRLEAEHPNFINDILFSRGDVISVTVMQEVQQLLFSIQQDKSLSSLFSEKEPEEINKILPVEFVSFDERIKNYIRNYGERCSDSELKMETVNYKEDSLLLISFLKSTASGAIIRRENNGFYDYHKILKQHYRFNFIKRMALQFLIRHTISKIKDRENYRFMRTQAFSLFRKVFRAIDNKLLVNGAIENKNDGLYLLLNEITDIHKQQQFTEIISERKKRYAEYKKTDRPNRYMKTSTGFIAMEADAPLKGDELKGTGCCSGIVKAETVFINKEEPASADYSGKILIADFFEPGKLNLFSQAAGIISARGSLLSHTAILCREMGIPSIVGAKGLLSKIKTGDVVEMNGSTGKIKIISNEQL